MEQPPPYSPEGGYPPQPSQGYAPPPNTGYPPAGPPPQNPTYPPQPQPGYPPDPMKNYGGGYPPQGQGYVQQPAGFSSQTNNSTTVVLQQQPQVVHTVVPVVNDQMGLSIFACLCCCWPIGIFAIMKSSESRNRYIAGDYAGAVASAQSARNLALAAIICGLVIIPLIIVLRVVVFAASQTDNYNN